MCGRVRLPSDYSELKINAVKDYYRDLKDQRRFNVPPTSIVPALISRRGKRTVEAMRWGLVPSWSQDEKKRLRYLQCQGRQRGCEAHVSRRLEGRPALPHHHGWLL